jgi:hypothetical protein
MSRVGLDNRPPERLLAPFAISNHALIRNSARSLSCVQYPSGIAPNLPDQYILYNYPLPTGVLTSGDFHTYAVWWKDAQTLLFYFDGQLVRQTTPAGPFNEQSFMFFDTEVFGSEGLPSVADLTDPAKNTFYVDYVRAFKLQRKVA